MADNEQQQEQQQPLINSKGWAIIYPLYMDKTKSIQQGRRIPKQFALDKPKASDIYICCKQLGLECVLENNKKHPRDQFTEGRVKVQFYDSNSKPKKVPLKQIECIAKNATENAEKKFVTKSMWACFDGIHFVESDLYIKIAALVPHIDYSKLSKDSKRDEKQKLKDAKKEEKKKAKKEDKKKK